MSWIILILTLSIFLYKFMFKQKALMIFIYALSIRLLFALIFLVLIKVETLPSIDRCNELFKTKGYGIEMIDCREYYETSLNFETFEPFKSYWGYSNWYERNPLYILYLHFTFQNIIILIILSAFTVFLIFKINKTAGIIFMFYPNSIFYSFIYSKTVLIVFLAVLILSLTKNKYWLIILYLILQVLFTSLFHYFTPNTIGMHEEFNKGFMNNVFELWKPATDWIYLLSGKWIIFLMFPFYVILYYLFIKYVPIKNVAFLLVIIFSICYGIKYAHPYHREILIPVMLIAVCLNYKLNPNLIKFYNNIKFKLNQHYEFIKWALNI